MNNLESNSGLNIDEMSIFLAIAFGLIPFLFHKFSSFILVNNNVLNGIKDNFLGIRGIIYFIGTHNSLNVRMFLVVVTSLLCYNLKILK